MQNLIKNIVIAILIGILIIVLNTYQNQIQSLFNAKIDWDNLLLGLRLFFASYIILKIVISPILSYILKSYKSKYQMRKTIDIIILLLLIAMVISIFVNSTASLIVSYGAISAGIALAFQDTLKNLFGGLTLRIKHIYKVGDRVEINGFIGDIVDIDFFYTTITESEHKQHGEQYTGRNIMVPNQQIVSSEIINYSYNNELVWDEYKTSITLDSNWQLFVEEMKSEIYELTKEYIELANERGIFTSNEYYIKKQTTKISNYIDITDTGLEINFRYLVDIDDQRVISHRISLKVLKLIDSNKGIKLINRNTIHVNKN